MPGGAELLLTFYDLRIALQLKLLYTDPIGVRSEPHSVRFSRVSRKVPRNVDKRRLKDRLMGNLIQQIVFQKIIRRRKNELSDRCILGARRCGGY